jgi:hypothetical protein
MACGHSGGDSRLQVLQVAQRADDPPTDLREYLVNVRIAAWLDLDKARCEALVGAIKVESLRKIPWKWGFKFMVLLDSEGQNAYARGVCRQAIDKSPLLLCDELGRRASCPPS